MAIALAPSAPRATSSPRCCCARPRPPAGSLLTFWGSAYRRLHDGAVDRSTDGIHACPQGAARFASWLLRGLARQPGGFTPAPADAWANSGWSGDAHFKGCG